MLGTISLVIYVLLCKSHASHIGLNTRVASIYAPLIYSYHHIMASFIYDRCMYVPTIQIGRYRQGIM